MIKSIEGKHIVNDQRKEKYIPISLRYGWHWSSIIMMFAGLDQRLYREAGCSRAGPSLTIPRVFWYSTGVILVSSLTIQMALKALCSKTGRCCDTATLITVTALLGVLFMILQWMGFRQIWRSGVTFKGSGGGQFLYIIAGLHAVHVLAGVVALFVMFIKAFASKIRSYDSVPVELMSTYWHFVDLLWIYLFIFFMAIK